MADHSPLIEQLETWARELEGLAVIPGTAGRRVIFERLIAGMREVAADLKSQGEDRRPRCPDCDSILVDMTAGPGEVDDGPPSYCTTCDREVATDAT